MTTYPPTASTSLPLTLPGDPTWGTLHELSEQRLDHPAAVSLYVALDDGGSRTPRELLQHEGSLVGELRKLARLAEPQAPGHDARWRCGRSPTGSHTTSTTAGRRVGTCTASPAS